MAHSDELVIRKVVLCPWKWFIEYSFDIDGLLCTVCLSNLVYRDPRHRVIRSVSLSGSTTSAFDDVSVDDVDFGWIQGND